MPKVMIVDDDQITVKLLRTLLEIDGFEVSMSPRGGDVVPMMDKHNPDLILIDYHLADMDGVEVIRALREMPQYANLPIVMASGLNVEQEAMEAGASRFLIKPFDPQALPGLFHQLIAG